MRATSMRWILAVVPGMLVLLVLGAYGRGCTGQGAEAISDSGTVVHLNLEGGFYGIIGDQGGRWDPADLPKEFQSDSLRVSFQGVITDRPTYHMWGRTIDLVSIKRLD